MAAQLNTRVDETIARSIRDLARHSAIPISVLVEAMVAWAMGLPHTHERAVYFAIQRWKEQTDAPMVRPPTRPRTGPNDGKRGITA